MAASGAAFITTHNLAVSYFGSVLTQSLFSAYQRMSLDRAIKVRMLWPMGVCKAEESRGMENGGWEMGSDSLIS